MQDDLGSFLKKEKERVITELKEIGILKSERVEKAIREIPREEFIPDYLKKYAYADTPLPIGYHQTTSALHMVTMLCEYTNLSEGNFTLEIGGGSGYMASVYHKVTNNEVITVEIIKELAIKSKKNLRKLNLDSFIHVINADASHSLPFRNNFDVIIVTACSPTIPDEYIEKLNENGRLIIPVGEHEYFQELVLIKKEKDGIKKHIISGCAFVPLIGTGRLFKPTL